MSTPAIPLDDALAKLRPHTTSKLPHAKKPALLLLALESTMPEPHTAVSYYAALIQTLQQAVTKELEGKDKKLDVSEGGLIPAVVYLLAVVVEYVPVPVLHASTSQGLLGPLFSKPPSQGSQDQTVLSLLPLCSTSAPALRSLITLMKTLLITPPHVTPSPLLSTPYLSTLQSLLSLILDARPRVRKLAQESLRDILASPPPPSIKHPYADRVAEWTVEILRSGGGYRGEEGEQRLIWGVGFIRLIASSWPADHLPPLLSTLLPLPPHPHLQSVTLSLLSHLLSKSTSTASLEANKIPTLLSTILASPPLALSPAIPAWLDVIQHGMIAYARDSPDKCAAELSSVWAKVWLYLEGEGSGRKEAEECLIGMARYCISEQLIEESIVESTSGGSSMEVEEKKKSKKDKKKHAGEENKSTLGSIIATLISSLHVLKAIPYLSSTLKITTALISRLRLRPSSSPSTTSAELLLQPLIKQVCALRLQRNFEFKEAADAVLGMAIEVVGPEVFLSWCPLNVDPDHQGSKEQPGRAFLLPLLKAKTTNTNLSYFTQTLVPLSEKLFNARTKAEAERRPMEAKIYEALTEQIWGTLKGFCDLPRDLPTSFTNQFAALITQVLYSQPSLRATLLRSLQTLVETNKSLSNSGAPSEEMKKSFGLDQTDGKKNLDFLKGISANLLAVLFNVFGQVGREQRGMVGEVIVSYLSISSEKDIDNTYQKVTTHLGSSLKIPFARVGNPSAASPTSHTMLDLLITLIPFLPASTSSSLFALASKPEMYGAEDPSVQKKSYRILARLIELKKVFSSTADSQKINDFVKLLTNSSESVSAAARRDRTLLLTEIVPILPKDSLHLIPSLIPEAVLGTKEVNEKTRNAAFDLVVLMGEKMAEGGVIHRGLMEGMEDAEMEDAATDAAASVPEFLTMVAAGLAGNSPHMISASITAISRLLFEFKDSIPSAMLSELIATLCVFVRSTNREIVKSSLGFVKVAVVSLSVADVEPHLPELVPGLLGWSHDHKNHFKGKVRHIFERLVRKFGYEPVFKSAGPDEGGRKFLENIRKRKERSKRKKEAHIAENDGDEYDDDEPSKPKTTTGNAFEDALYGSESEMDDTDDEGVRDAPATKEQRGKGKAKANQRSAAYIREEGDQPMDLLDRSLAGNISKVDPSAHSKRRKPGQDASTFRTDEDSGKMVFNEDASDDGEAGEGDAMDENEQLEGRAHQELLTSTDGMTRGPNGKIAFNKNTKRGRALEMEGDITTADGDSQPQRKKKTKRESVKVGSDFKAKRAGGDVKRNGGPDPFAYVPISAGNASGRHRGGPRLNITGKKRGSAK